ncbi:MAG: hypothetical protein K6U74_10700 [Firmicutes bacterium]|nr:hypothetical protein [Bacillota bacterium]
MFNIKTYDVFQGIAREDNFVVAAIFSLDDYKEMGHTLDNYKDYLLQRQSCLDEFIYEPVRVVHVPFDRETYEQWLKKNPYWAGTPESYSAWALDMAKNPTALSVLSDKYPIMPAPPMDEEITSLVLFGVIPALISDKDEARLLAGRLPKEVTDGVLNEFKKIFYAVPGFERLSPLRCRGAKIYVGECLIPPFRVEEFEAACSENILLNLPGGIAPVPGRCRIKVSELQTGLPSEGLAMAPVLLPVVVVGAAAEVDYCEYLVDSLSGEVGKAGEVLHNLVTQSFKHYFSDIFVPFIQSYEIWEYLDNVLRDGEGLEICSVRQPHRPRKNKNGNGNIKRIK